MYDGQMSATGHLLPWLLTIVIFGVWLWLLAPRKNQSRWWVISVLLPGLSVFVLIWMSSLTDKSVLDRLAELESGTPSSA